MSLKEIIEKDLKESMLAKNVDKTRTLRALKSAISIEETSGKGGVSADTEMKILVKSVKQRKESAAIYLTENRTDLYDIEIVEISILENYLPKQLSEEEIDTNIKSIISQVSATSIKDMGKVIGLASKMMAGQADGRVISDKVKTLLV